jgi:hypothetical protein
MAVFIEADIVSVYVCQNAKNIVKERLRWVLSICNKEVKLVDVAKV